MKTDITAQILDQERDGRYIDDDARVSPAAVYHYSDDNPDDGFGPNGIEVALWPEAGRAAISGGGDWLWGDYDPATETADDLIALYLADWEAWEARN